MPFLDWKARHTFWFLKICATLDLRFPLFVLLLSKKENLEEWSRTSPIQHMLWSFLTLVDTRGIYCNICVDIAHPSSEAFDRLHRLVRSEALRHRGFGTQLTVSTCDTNWTWNAVCVVASATVPLRHPPLTQKEVWFNISPLCIMLAVVRAWKKGRVAAQRRECRW